MYIIVVAGAWAGFLVYWAKSTIGQSGCSRDAASLAGAFPSTRQELDLDSPRLEDPFSCHEVSEMIHQNAPLTSHRFNYLRRRAYVHDAECFEEHYALFRRAFLLRRTSTSGKHFNLHIPKSGGTSLCEMARRNNLTVPTDSSNCQYLPAGAPYWCCKDMDARRYMSCPELDRKFGMHQFVANENYLDHPLCFDDRLYSINLREPVTRAISNVETYIPFIGNAGGNHPYYGRRLNLIQSNYLTWALVAGLRGEDASSGINHRFDYVPGSTRDDLLVAKFVLGQFDFLLGVDAQESCNDVILTLMGMRYNKFPRYTNDRWVVVEANSTIRNKSSDDPRRYYRRDSYERLNVIDARLFEYATDLIRADCQFFERIIADEADRDGLPSLELYQTK